MICSENAEYARKRTLSEQQPEHASNMLSQKEFSEDLTKTEKVENDPNAVPTSPTQEQFEDPNQQERGRGFLGSIFGYFKKGPTQPSTDFTPTKPVPDDNRGRQ